MTGLFWLYIHLQLVITRQESNWLEYLCSDLDPTEMTNKIVTQLISEGQDFSPSFIYYI